MKDTNKKAYIEKLKSEIKELERCNAILEKENSDLKYRLEKNKEYINNLICRFEVVRDIHEKAIEKANSAEKSYKELITKIRKERIKYTADIKNLINKMK